MGWDALDQWGRARVIERLSGGVRNDVRLVELGDRRVVARLGSRAHEDLAWETELVGFLAASGLSVPALVPALDGRPFVDGLVVMELVEGRQPESPEDWRMVAHYLERLHELARGWRQRPGWASSSNLVTVDAGTSIDLRAMPAEAVVRCRAAWSRLAGVERTVIHGDPNPGNVRIDGDRVVLIDWDEARVDASELDLVLPHNAAGLDAAQLAAASQASSAWEAAVCWQAEPDYARRRLAEVASA